MYPLSNVQYIFRVYGLSVVSA